MFNNESFDTSLNAIFQTILFYLYFEASSLPPPPQEQKRACYPYVIFFIKLGRHSMLFVRTISVRGDSYLSSKERKTNTPTATETRGILYDTYQGNPDCEYALYLLAVSVMS